MTAFERIMSQQVPEWAAKFDAKSRDYNSASTGWEPHTFLGVKGQFADIWRKIGKLKKSLWDEERLTGEQPREIIQDLISHLFLTLDLMGPEPALYPGVTLETEGERPLAPGVTLIEDANLPPGMAVMGLPDGGDREGPRRLGITPDEWERVKVLADAVHNQGKPEILESNGYFLQVDQSPMGMCCENCRWERTMETGKQEFHTYLGNCKYRIRRRR